MTDDGLMYISCCFCSLSLSFDADKWKDVPACVRISSHTCDVTSAKAKGEHGCVTLRVQAERHNLTSTPAQACSRQGKKPRAAMQAGR